MKYLFITTLFLLNFSLIKSQTTAEDDFQEGIRFSESKNFVMAIISYSAAILKNPYDWNYYRYRSWAYYETKNYENALLDINMALDLKPMHENFTCLFIRSRIYNEMRDYKKAISDLTYGINYFKDELETKIGFLHLDRGKAYLYSGEKDKACVDFQESLNRRMSDAGKFLEKFCK
jgi:tetratricopeptide (TPR) repeat protein